MSECKKEKEREREREREKEREEKIMRLAMRGRQKESGQISIQLPIHSYTVERRGEERRKMQ